MTIEAGVTFFTAPKPFLDPHITTIQRNALDSWLQQSPPIELIMIGDEPGIERVALELAARHLPEVRRNDKATPLISSVFEMAQSEAAYPIAVYLNTDIVLMSDFRLAITEVAQQFERFLVVGQRWDLEVRDRLEFEPGWESVLRRKLERNGNLHPAAGSDYFVFPTGLLRGLPPFALGRAGWDNWMIYAGRRMRIPVVDATRTITAIHQSHDYGHLEGGTPHYRLPESDQNVRLAGGRQMIFTLADASWRLDQGGLRKLAWLETGIGRRVETGIVSRLGPGAALRVVWSALHPVETIRTALAMVRGLARRFVSVSQKD